MLSTTVITCTLILSMCVKQMTRSNCAVAQFDQVIGFRVRVISEAFNIIKNRNVSLFFYVLQRMPIRANGIHFSTTSILLKLFFLSRYAAELRNGEYA